MLLLFLACISYQALVNPSADARTVRMGAFDTAPRGTITQAEFTRAQNAATRNGSEAGTITFGNRTWTAATNFNISRERVTLRGAGTGRTTLQARSASNSRRDNVIQVSARIATVTRMTIRGGSPLTYPDGFLGFGSGIPGNVVPGDNDSAILQRPATGIENAIRVTTAGRRFAITDCVLRRVSVGVRFNPRIALDGFRCQNVDFFTLNAMIFAAEQRPSPGSGDVSTPNPNRAFTIDNARLRIDPNGPTINRAGDLLHPGRGIILDFGNASFGSSAVSPPVNLRGSVIRNCNIPRVTSWNIGMNRVGNITLRDNVLGGGGAGNSTTFRHVLHLEDQCRNITIRDNDFTQRTTNNNGRRLSNVVFAWLGGDNGFPQLSNNFGNSFSGGAPLLGTGRNVPQNANFGNFDRQRR